MQASLQRKHAFTQARFNGITTAHLHSCTEARPYACTNARMLAFKDALIHENKQAPSTQALMHARALARKNSGTQAILHASIDQASMQACMHTTTPTCKHAFIRNPERMHRSTQEKLQASTHVGKQHYTQARLNASKQSRNHARRL
jgi:hypothetical protein